MGSEFDESFVHFVKLPSEEVFKVDCDWSDMRSVSNPRLTKLLSEEFEAPSPCIRIWVHLD